MRIEELLAKKRTLSFEVYPPKKTESGTETLFRAIDELKEFHPDFISVTYGAGGSNARNAVEIARHLKSVGIEPLAHVTGGPSSPEEIDKTARALQQAGVENVLALRGDRPRDFEAEYCKYFRHATDLMDYLKKYDFSLGGACYPEGHAECESLYADLVNLKKKEECGARFLVSQLFYDNAYYYRLVAEARKIGIRSPIIPGVMPLVSAKNIPNIKQMCGSTIPLEFRNMIEFYADDPVTLREVGLNFAVYQIMDLIAKGAPGIHLYIMNRAETAAEIVSRLKNVFHELF